MRNNTTPQTVLSTGTCSSAHTYGNVASAVREIIKSFFPREFFKYIHISTELLSKEMRDERVNTNIEFSKKLKPKFSINPTFSSLSDEDKFLGGTLLTNNSSSFNGTISRKVMMDLLYDNKRNIGLMYTMTRDRLEFDINMIMPTLFSQLDVYKTMRHQWNWDSPTYINQSLETMIPRSMISYIGKLNSINIDNKQEFIMLEYLNNHSLYPITYKMRNSTSRDEYFMYYGIKFLISFTNLEIDEGNKKGMVEDSFRISFKVTVDFNLPAAFYLIGTPEYASNSDIQIVVDSYNEQDIIPIYTINNFFNNIRPTDTSFELYTTSLFKTDMTNGDDTLEIYDVFTSAELHDLIRQHFASNIPISTFLEIQILKDNTLSTDWDIDWNTCVLTIHNSDSESTYRLIVFINRLYVNERIRNLIEAENYDKGLETKNIMSIQ